MEMQVIPSTHRRHNPGFLVCGAVVFLALATVLAQPSWQLITTDAQTRGTETNTLTCGTSGPDDCSYQTMLTYQVQGQTYSQTIDGWLALHGSESATILYDPHLPDQATVNSFTNLWLWPFVWMMVGVWFMALSLGRIALNRLITRTEARWATMERGGMP
jgi:hypothetical protein